MWMMWMCGGQNVDDVDVRWMLGLKVHFGISNNIDLSGVEITRVACITIKFQLNWNHVRLVSQIFFDS